MLEIRPVELRDAKAYIAEHHRHHKPPVGHRFSVGVYYGEELVGVAVCGRPVARNTDASSVLEVTRLCTAGHHNACSKLLGACQRAAKALGFKRIQTFTLCKETGASLRAVGWINDAVLEGKHWGNEKRPRNVMRHTFYAKRRWYKELQ